MFVSYDFTSKTIETLRANNRATEMLGYLQLIDSDENSGIREIKLFNIFFGHQKFVLSTVRKLCDS